MHHDNRPVRIIRPGDRTPLDAVAAMTERERLSQNGVAPNRIDVLTSIDGVAFEEAWPAAGRAQDVADIACLEEDGPGA